MDMHKTCRVCLEEGAFTSIYSTDFAMMPCVMMMICAKIRVYKTDGLPTVICNNCIYRLGVAYHFKQECENSDLRLRQYLGLPDRSYGVSDAQTNTEVVNVSKGKLSNVSFDQDDGGLDEYKQKTCFPKKCKRQSRYKRKAPGEYKKRGPKPMPKLAQTCYECNKTFKCQAQLQMHTRIHSGEKPFGCHYCPRRFAQKYNLQIHERIHSGERPYQCEICSKQFSALGNFQAHQKIHSGIRDQICPVCQKAFYSAGDLTKHMVTHAGTKNYHCDICGKAYSRQRDMHAHKRKLHSSIQENRIVNENIEKPPISGNNVISICNALNHHQFKCPECGKDFASAGSLSVHFRTHSNNNLLSFPIVGQMGHPPPSHPHVPTPHHYHSQPPPAIASIHQPHETLQQHTHHLTINSIQSESPIESNNPNSSMSVMHHLLPIHPPSTHVIPPPPLGTSSEQSTIMMHAPQRLHPY